jgi:hypothetical protein
MEENKLVLGEAPVSFSELVSSSTYVSSFFPLPTLSGSSNRLSGSTCSTSVASLFVLLSPSSDGISSVS